MTRLPSGLRLLALFTALAVFTVGEVWAAPPLSKTRLRGSGHGKTQIAKGDPAKADAGGQSEDVSGLPLYEVPETKASTDMFGILISGDGGWWTLDQTVSAVLAGHGVPMVGLSSYKYFSSARTPEGTTADMEKIVRHYLAKWKKEKVVLVGYSFGAEIVPFVATRLPEDLKKRVAAVVMIGPSSDTTFEFHPTDWVISLGARKSYAVQPEIERLFGSKLICAYADKDDTCICNKLDTSKVSIVKRSGDHHFGGDFKGLGEAIWKALEQK